SNIIIIYRLTFYSLQSGYPVKKKRVEIIREPYTFNVLFKMITPFLDQTALSRVHFHGDDLQKLHKCIPKDILPSEFQGDKPPFVTQEFFTMLKSTESLFVDDNEYNYKLSEI
ncbi:unnamed protein product, partial [Ixodes pacificus]